MLGEYVREQLRVALCDLPLGQKGQIAIMSDMAGGDDYTDRPTREVESGESVVKIEAEPVRYREGKKYKQNKPLILEAAFKTGIWRQAVNKLPDLHLAWAKYCYGEDLKFDHQLIICKDIWDRFLVRESETRTRKMAEKMQQKLRSLVLLAVQVSVGKVRGPQLEYTGAHLSQLLGIKPNNWQGHYLPRWSLLLALCEELDNEVIAHVERQHKAERDGRRRTRLSV
ncbi:bacteriophage antitermination protein Q [Pantoea stewartii]|uniref:Antiterminator Q n=1 Tax=Pantoea stewartii subsp. stewartii DC283 TaxID=660596 RepID=H3RLJ1_PANSE|nr:bacteriophage antitermination protein Q [Pantoea stewartii]ARF52750.1 hypothetical protein DSJ_26435 [Pantoea stewartii subsp. stewartii DC283]EHT97704.1 antiterminator Q [Pantoea stewartii subsp. stewartii DC283]KAB0554017.1 hypothetical protein F7Q90_12570 [Pantoea stewartii subsp. stewartii]